MTRVIVAVVLGALAAIVTGSLLGGTASVDNLAVSAEGNGPWGVLQAGGLLFFAFAGYARIATLGEEVVDPRRTIPRAIPVALGITLVVYSAVAVSALLAVGPRALAASSAPLATAVEAGSADWLVPAARVGGVVASAGVLLSLAVGVSRTVFAMAANGALPRWLDAVHPVHRVPHRAEVAVGAVVVAVVLLVDVRGAIGFSSFAVLSYYAITNASTWTLPSELRRWPRALSAVGLAGCLLLAFTLPGSAVASGTAVLALGALAGAGSRRAARARPD